MSGGFSREASINLCWEAKTDLCACYATWSLPLRNPKNTARGLFRIQMFHVKTKSQIFRHKWIELEVNFQHYSSVDCSTKKTLAVDVQLNVWWWIWNEIKKRSACLLMGRIEGRERRDRLCLTHEAGFIISIVGKKPSEYKQHERCLSDKANTKLIAWKWRFYGKLNASSLSLTHEMQS